MQGMGSRGILATLAVVILAFAAASIAFVAWLPPSPPGGAAAAPAVSRPVTCTVGQFIASQGARELDPSLEHLRSRLDKPPFTAFERFEFLVSHEFPCTREQVTLPLHGGGELTLRPMGRSAVDREWSIEAHDEAGRRVVHTRATVHPNRPLLIVTGATEPESVVIWIESA